MAVEKYTIGPTGSQYWELGSKLHRTDGSAFIDSDGTEIWYHHGQRHRIDGPAIIHSEGVSVWYVNDKRHRIDGPAIIGPEDYRKWIINGKNITDEVEQWMELREISWPWDRETQVEFQLTFT